METKQIEEALEIIEVELANAEFALEVALSEELDHCEPTVSEAESRHRIERLKKVRSVLFGAKAIADCFDRINSELGPNHDAD